MRTIERARLVVAAAACLLGAWGARAEVPNRTPVQLMEEATVIVVGPVIEHYTQSMGMQTRYFTTIRAEKVEKGSVKPGENISVRWAHNSLLPMTAGSSGHRGERVAIGHVVRVYARGDEVVFPNGWAGAEPLFVTEVLRSGADAEALSAAAKTAHEHRCFEEESLAYAALLKLRDTPDDRLGLGTALWHQGRFKESAEALRPLAMKKSEAAAGAGDAAGKPAEGTKKDRWDDPVQKARMLLAHALWDMDDRAGYCRAHVEFARVDDARQEWEHAREIAEYLGDKDAAREADKRLEKIGK